MLPHRRFFGHPRIEAGRKTVTSEGRGRPWWSLDASKSGMRVRGQWLGPAPRREPGGFAFLCRRPQAPAEV
ncbi:protein of unknown function [Methylorubrum extorquens]|uniref:Uncharacterized protein n=1 Tax=Methylorubrum extorquens TaxID=408 RepID=A0A2N9ATS5_METEX|nr:protein of unknown function [Methylorubrum extorquens]